MITTTLKIALLALLYLISLSPNLAGAEAPSKNPWHSLESSLLQVYKTYDPDAALLNKTAITEQITVYLEAGLWSHAEVLLKKQPAPERPLIKGLWLQLHLVRGEYALLYDGYTADPVQFANNRILILGAVQGALRQRHYQEALDLIASLPPETEAGPEQHYFSALAYWGLHDQTHIDSVLKKALAWAEDDSDSEWAARIHLLQVYYHLSQKSYDLAFESMGALFDNNADLALLALTWGYFKLGSTNNLFSILQALDERHANSPYHSQIFRILSRFLIEDGNLSGAILMDQRERDELKKQIEVLEAETEQLRRGIATGTRLQAPGSLLSATLAELQDKVGEKREITALYWFADLQQRRSILQGLKKRALEIDAEQRRLQMEMLRRCITLANQAQHGNNLAKVTDAAKHYRRAQHFAATNQQDAMLKALEALVETAPSSPYAFESHFRLGELAFSKGDYQGALSHYRIIIDDVNAPLYPLSLYKAAWANHLLGQDQEAIRLVIQQEIHFSLAADPNQPVIQAVSTSIASKSNNKAACETLRTPQERKEPYRLLSLATKRLGGPAKLLPLLSELMPQARFNFVQQTVDYYREQKQADSLVDLIQHWIKTYPFDLNTPLLHQQWVKLIKQSDTISLQEVIAARTDFVNRYQPGGLWAEFNFGSAHIATNTTAQDKAPSLGGYEEMQKEGSRLTFLRQSHIAQLGPVKDLLKTHLRFLMTHYYAEAKKSNKLPAFKAVLPWYQRYLFVFDDAPQIGKDRFLYAEILTKLTDTDEAIEAYRDSAYNDPPHALSADAGHQELLLIENGYSNSGPEIEGAYERFAARFPEDPRVDAFAMRLADLAFQAGDFSRSRYYAKKVSLKALKASPHRGSQQMDAHRLVVQGYLKQGAYAQAIGYLDELFARQSDADTQTALHPLRVLSHFQHGEHLKKQGAKLLAAENYWQAYRFGEESDMGPLALFEAALLWNESRQDQQAEEALLLFSSRYPDSALNHPAHIQLATLYQRQNHPLKAAAIYEGLAKNTQNRALSEQAFEQAISLYIATESWEKVTQLAMDKASPDGKAPTLRAQGADAGRWMMMAAEATLKLGNKQSAIKILTKLVAATQGKSSESPHVAKAHFLLAEAKIEGFKTLQLVAPLEESLEKKKALFEDLLANYDEAINHPSPKLALNANFRIGELFELFSQALLESERPDDLSFDEEELYEELLIEQALPYFEQAEATYQQNIVLAEEIGLDNEWVTKSKQHLFMIQQKIDLISRGEMDLLG